MNKYFFILTILICLSADATQTLVKREMFVGTGTLTSSNTDQLDFVTADNLYCRPVGPQVGGSAPGWSADPHAGGNVNGMQAGFVLNLPSTSTYVPNGIVGGWFWIDEKSATATQ